MFVARTVLLALLVATPALGQTTAAPPSSPMAEAFFEFMMARRLDASGDPAGALAALERARKLDPVSAEIVAELAAFHSRQNKLDLAVIAADQALKLDARNVEAHHVLAQVYSSWAEGGAPLPAGQTQATARAAAIEHLVAIQASPLMATDPNLQMTLGRLQLRAGRAEIAVPILERVSAQAPWAAEPLLLLYEAKIALGKLDEAEEALAGAAAVNPRYFSQLGQFYERQGKWADAAGAYTEAVKGARGGASRDLQMRLAGALANVDGGADKARAVIAEILKSSPSDTRALYLLSSVERAQGNLAGAEAAARRILTSDPASVTGLYALVLALSDRFDYKQVVEVAAPFAKEPAVRAKGREAEGAAVLVQLGIANQGLGDYDAAIAAFSAARSLTPRDRDLEAYVIQAHLTARRFDRADALARESLARNPDQPRMVRLRAQALARAGKVAEANKLLEDGVAARPDSREYIVGLADLYTEQKRAADALRMLEQARKTFGDDEALTMRVVSAYEAGGRLAEAEKELRRMMAADPSNASAMNSLGYLLADHGLRLTEAVELAQRAVKIEPDNPSYLDTLGWALFKQGRAEEADAPLARAAGMLRGNSVIQDHHGDVLARRGRSADAIAAWERALAGDGDQIDRAAIEKKIKAARAKTR
jgi:tetratricopeptide (TPR) repeat protein